MGGHLRIRDLITGVIRFTLSDTRSVLYAGAACLIALLPFGLPLITGYLLRCIRSVLYREEQLPEFRKNLPDMYVEGAIFCLIFLLQEFVFLSFVFMIVFGVVVLDLGITPGLTAVLPNTSTTTGIILAVSIQAALLFVLMIVNLAWSCILAVSAVIFADTGMVSAAINPAIAFDLIRKNLFSFVVSLLSLLVISAFLLLFSALILVIPWILALELISSAYIMARFYHAARYENVAAKDVKGF